MDCEKFETALMDELYGELDELTSAAAKRHVSGCARCSALIGGLRATRRVATLPRVEPPEGLEQRILAAAAAATPKVVPFRGRLARAVSLGGSWAMRPQTAMAAVFLVMIGTSVLLLRGKSSRAPASAQITVTEEGTPAPASPALASSTPPEPAPAPDEPTAAFALRQQEKQPGTAGLDSPSDDTMRARAMPKTAKADEGVGGGLAMNAPARVAAGAGAGYAVASPPMAPMAAAPAGAAAGAAAGPARPFAVPPAAQAEFEAPAAAEAPVADPTDELWAARTARDAAARQGHVCPSGARFDAVASRAPGTQAGWDALYEGALCYESAGDYGSARTRLGTLLGVPSYRDRARVMLDRINKEQSGGVAARAAPATAPKAAAPARPPPSVSDGF